MKHLKATIGGLLVAAILVALMVAHFMGISAYVITGASMTGEISKGSVAIDRNVPVSALRVGDVITFHPPNSSSNVTHRIIEVTKDKDGNPVFRTKGDFNQAVDPWQFTLDREVQARYIFAVPYVGFGLAAFTLRWVRAGILALVGLLILAITITWFRKTPASDDEFEEMVLYRTGQLR
jgi:signal peptidase I